MQMKKFKITLVSKSKLYQKITNSKFMKHISERRKKKLLRLGFVYGSLKKYNIIASINGLLLLKYESKTIQIEKEVPFKVMQTRNIRGKKVLFFNDENKND